MWKYFAYNNIIKWIDILPALIVNYNNSYHRSIKMTLVKGSKIESFKKIYNNAFPVEEMRTRKTNFSLGDRVRYVKMFKDFRKAICHF